uniref:Uncharacterized protein n=1 Tax=Anguilla anguilla TaxID=7936 RepID=A0A0E9RA29_ANGAN
MCYLEISRVNLFEKSYYFENSLQFSVIHIVCDMPLIR